MKVVAFEKDTCNAKLGRFHALLNRYQDAHNLVSKRINKNKVRLEAVCVAAANNIEDAVSNVLRGVVLSMKYCIGQNTARARVAVGKLRLKVVKILLRIENKIYDILYGHSVFDNSPLGTTRVILSHEVVCFPEPMLRSLTELGPWAMLASDELVACKKTFRTVRKPFLKRC